MQTFVEYLFILAIVHLSGVARFLVMQGNMHLQLHESEVTTERAKPPNATFHCQDHQAARQFDLLTPAKNSLLAVPQAACGRDHCRAHVTEAESKRMRDCFASVSLKRPTPVCVQRSLPWCSLLQNMSRVSVESSCTSERSY